MKEENEKRDIFAEKQRRKVLRTDANNGYSLNHLNMIYNTFTKYKLQYTIHFIYNVTNSKFTILTCFIEVLIKNVIQNTISIYEIR